MVTISKQMQILKMFALRIEKIANHKKLKLAYTYSPAKKEITISTNMGSFALDANNEKEFYKKISILNGYLRFIENMEFLKNG